MITAAQRHQHLAPLYHRNSSRGSFTAGGNTPRPFQKVDTPRRGPLSTAQKVAIALTALIGSNDNSFDPSCLNGDVGPTAGLFYTKNICDLPLTTYLERFEKMAHEMSQSVYILAMVYMVRFCHRKDMKPKTSGSVPMFINSYNMHRIVFVAVVLAHKNLDDACYRNSYFAKVGGVHKDELNRLETAFLNEINFELYVDPHVFATYADAIGERSYKKLCNQSIFLDFDESYQ